MYIIVVLLTAGEHIQRGWRTRGSAETAPIGGTHTSQKTRNGSFVSDYLEFYLIGLFPTDRCWTIMLVQCSRSTVRLVS